MDWGALKLKDNVHDAITKLQELHFLQASNQMYKVAHRELADDQPLSIPVSNSKAQ
jgi:hypothetical protein